MATPAGAGTVYVVVVVVVVVGWAVGGGFVGSVVPGGATAAMTISGSAGGADAVSVKECVYKTAVKYLG